MLQRQTAYKIQAKDFLEGQAVFDGDRLTALDCKGKRVLRINMVGNVVDKYVNPEKRYCSLTIDDGSGQVRLKGFSDQFELLSGPDIGDTVYVVGMVRYFNNELYVMPEIVRKTEPIWLSIRSLEIGVDKTINTPSPAQPSSVQSTPSSSSSNSMGSTDNYSATMKSESAPMIKTEKVIQARDDNASLTPQGNIDSPKLKVLNAIKRETEIDFGKLGIITGISPEEINPIINDLLSEGEIYEPKPGYLCAVN